MNSIVMFGNIMNLYSSFINSYYPLQNINSRKTHQLKFSFMNLFGLIMNSYGHCHELVWLQTMN